MKFLFGLAILLTFVALVVSIQTGAIVWGLWITTALCTYLPLGLILRRR